MEYNYLKYKVKYLELKKKLLGGDISINPANQIANYIVKYMIFKTPSRFNILIRQLMSFGDSYHDFKQDVGQLYIHELIVYLGLIEDEDKIYKSETEQVALIPIFNLFSPKNYEIKRLVDSICYSLNQENRLELKFLTKETKIRTIDLITVALENPSVLPVTTSIVCDATMKGSVKQIFETLITDCTNSNDNVTLYYFSRRYDPCPDLCNFDGFVFKHMNGTRPHQIYSQFLNLFFTCPNFPSLNLTYEFITDKCVNKIILIIRFPLPPEPNEHDAYPLIHRFNKIENIISILKCLLEEEDIFNTELVLNSNYLNLMTFDEKDKAQLNTLLLIAKLINHLKGDAAPPINITTIILDNLRTYRIFGVELQQIYPTRGTKERPKLNERQQKVLYLITKIKEVLNIPANDELKKRIIYFIHALKRSGDWMQTIDAMTLDTATTLHNYLIYSDPSLPKPATNITEDPDTIIFTADGAYLATILALNSYLLYLQGLNEVKTTYKIKFIFHTNEIIITNLPDYQKLTSDLQYMLIKEPSVTLPAAATATAATAAAEEGTGKTPP
jgi:hypothetical protein